jgi:hypothetical protein
VFCNCYYTVDDRSLLTINRHIRLWTLPNILHHWLFKLFLWSIILLLWDMTHRSAWTTIGPWQNNCLHNSTAMWHIPAHSFVPPLSEQSHCYWQWDRLRKLKHFWYAKQHLLKILCSFQTWLGVVVVAVVLVKGQPSESTYPRSTDFWNEDLQIMWLWVDISIWYVHLLRERQDMWLHMMVNVKRLTRHKLYVKNSLLITRHTWPYNEKERQWQQKGNATGLIAMKKFTEIKWFSV